MTFRGLLGNPRLTDPVRAALSSRRPTGRSTACSAGGGKANSLLEAETALSLRMEKRRIMRKTRADRVARQYDRWNYPAPIEDVEVWLQSNWEWFDPSHSQHILWPSKHYKPDMDILIAGCGTNQAAVIAFTNPDARIVGIDVSSSSLDHERYLRDKYGLRNLTLRQLPLEEAPSLGLDFDLVVSTGVLHHLSDPLAGLKAIAACSREDAAIGIMLYAKYGRIGVEMLSSAFKDIGLDQSESSVVIMRNILAMLPENHPIQSYLTITRDLTSDAALVDTFLNARERSYTVQECINLVEDAGLLFQGWFLNAPYYFHDILTSVEGIASVIKNLPKRKQWSIMERLYPANACHFFLACRRERPTASYVIDFSSDACLEYIPEFRKGCGLSGHTIYRSDWSMGMNEAQLSLVKCVDGRRSIREILDSMLGIGEVRAVARREGETFARDLFRSLWQLDFIALAHPGR